MNNVVEMTLVTVRWLSVDSFFSVFHFDARYLIAKKASPPTRRQLSIAPFFSHRLYKYRNSRFVKEEIQFSRWSKRIARARHENRMLTEIIFLLVGPEIIVCLLVMRVYWLAVSYVRCMFFFFLKESTFTYLFYFSHFSHYLLFILPPPPFPPPLLSAFHQFRI